jgi:hypothetical protein
MDNIDRRSESEKAFAEARGWIPSHRTVSLSDIAAGRRSSRREEYASVQLGDMYDHGTEYEYLGTTRPAAIIVHPYRRFTAAQVQEIAQRFGIQGAIIDPSMYHNPSAQTIVFCKR